MDTQLEQNVELATEDSGDGGSTESTQNLLTALGRFQRQLTDAHGDSSSSSWSDECMNQLITAVDISLAQEWMPIVEALTDTGRILQTYKNSDRAQDAVPFLNDAYEVLCLLVGDLIVENDSGALVSNWRRLYSGAVRAIEDTGLVLARDDDDGSEESALPEATLEIRLPEGMVETVDSASSPPDELPMLDELSPLDGPIDQGIEAPANETPELDSSLEAPGETELMSPDEVYPDSSEPISVEPIEITSEPAVDILEIDELASEVSVEAETAAPEPVVDILEIDEPAVELSVEPENAVPEVSADVLEIEELADVPVTETPSVVIEILDRISEQLAVLQNGSGEARDLAMERLQGGLSALTREASDNGHAVAERLCTLMTSACELFAQADEKATERVIDLGYAFCGTYMEAAEQGETDPVLNWQSECQAIVAELKPDTSAPEEAVQIEEIEMIEDGVVEIAETDEEAATSAPETPDEISEEWMLLEPENGSTSTVTEEPQTSASMENAVDGSPAEESKISEAPVKYVELLASAQEAALKGDRAAAQYFALQAAVHIARTDVEKAEEHLGQTEGRLNDSLKAAETAANEVKEAEARAREISTEMVSAEKSLGEVKQSEAEVAQEVQDIQANIDDLDRQIQELETRRTEETEKRSQAQGRLSDAENVTAQSQAQLEESKKSEEDSRNYLERCRQHIKDEQEISGRIELEVQKAREHLAQREHSCEEIDDTIAKTCGDEPPANSEDTADSLLF
ncbi:MAG: hypothetical protein IID08_04740 [Candidatus Hydrogenedentes bacterium]|nr:hypothetical protein [Candidatus Hydrogenedentota bacterium]